MGVWVVFGRREPRLLTQDYAGSVRELQQRQTRTTMRGVQVGTCSGACGVFYRANRVCVRALYGLGQDLNLATRIDDFGGGGWGGMGTFAPAAR